MEKHVIGWREWVSFPELGIDAIKAKVDTGARTSVIHAYVTETFVERGRARVRFGVHPLQQKKQPEIMCVADILDQRLVSDSGGHREKRYVIETNVRLGDQIWPIEATLTNRDTMMFRVLLGRTALRGRFIVDSGRSYVFGRQMDGPGHRPGHGPSTLRSKKPRTTK